MFVVCLNILFFVLNMFSESQCCRTQFPPGPGAEAEEPAGPLRSGGDRIEAPTTPRSWTRPSPMIRAAAAAAAASESVVVSLFFVCVLNTKMLFQYCLVVSNCCFDVLGRSGAKLVRLWSRLSFVGDSKRNPCSLFCKNVKTVVCFADFANKKREHQNN